MPSALRRVRIAGGRLVPGGVRSAGGVALGGLAVAPGGRALAVGATADPRTAFPGPARGRTEVWLVDPPSTRAGVVEPPSPRALLLLVEGDGARRAWSGPGSVTLAWR